MYQCSTLTHSLCFPHSLPPSFAVYLSQPYRRGDGITVDKMATPPAYLSQSKDHVRAVVNRVKLLVDPPGARGRRHDVDKVSSRRSVDGSVKMGGGFVYRSNIEIDFTRPTPSRPTYSHGLFLFPFSNELAAKMLDASTKDHAPAKLNEHAAAGVPTKHGHFQSGNKSWLDLSPEERQSNSISLQHLHRDVVRVHPAPGRVS